MVRERGTVLGRKEYQPKGDYVKRSNDDYGA